MVGGRLFLLEKKTVPATLVTPCERFILLLFLQASPPLAPLRLRLRTRSEGKSSLLQVV